MMTIGEQKVFISSNFTTVPFLCPPPCGPFSFKRAPEAVFPIKRKKGWRTPASAPFLYVLLHFNRLHRTLLRAFAAAHTLAVVHMGQVTVYGNGLMLALLCTDTAAQTACGAGLLYCRSPVAACAAHRYLLIRRYQLNEPLGTGLRAFSTAGALAFVYDGYAVFHMDSVKLAGLHTGAEAQTAVIAFPDRNS